MNVVVLGASGMVGRGALIECLESAEVRSVLAVGRRSCGVAHPKLRELRVPDLAHLATFADELTGYAACFFCVGVSAAGMSEATYRRVTYDLTVDAAGLLADLNPGLTFCYVSGQGTDGTGRSRFMWARVKGETENELLRMPMKAYMFRPGFIQPMKGTRSKTAAYRVFYAFTKPFFPVFGRLFPRHVTTTVNVGRAMIQAALRGYPKSVLETPDINALAADAGRPHMEEA